MVRDLDRASALEISKIFLDDFGQRVEQLLETLRADNAAEAARQAHALKSSAANCGLRQFSEAMRRLELAGNQQDYDTLQILASTISPLYEESRDALIADRKTYEG
jgi:HPt (histidine-containing phosphotransfer) domain-containing protein